ACCSRGGSRSSPSLSRLRPRPKLIGERGPVSSPGPCRLRSMKNTRWLSLLVLCTGFLLIVVDMTIVNVALPSIQRDLAFSQSGLAWVINAYLIAFAGLLLLAGRLGDLIGRKRVYLAGLALFTVASLLC